MHIGMIGGIGPAATDYYYRIIIRAFEVQGVDLELTMVHASAPTLLKNLGDDNKRDQVEIYDKLTKRLKSAGADCVVITSIAGHFCIDEFKEISSLPVISMIETTNNSISKSGLRKIGIIGTKTVMESALYGGIDSAEVVAPAGRLLDAVHDAYVAMASTGSVSVEQREIFDEACKSMLTEQGVDSILLGGTDLALVYSEDETRFPIIDCAAIHCRAIVLEALGN